MTSRLIPLLLFLIIGQNLQAQTAANDNRANAIALSGDTASSSSNNTNATNELGDYDYRTIWWRWTAGGSGNASFSTTGSTAANLNLQIYVLEGGAATGLVAYSPGAGSPPSATFPVAAGTTYLIGVGSASTSSASGTVQMAVGLNRSTQVGGLNVPNAATMSNDSFARRIALTGTSVTGIAHNFSATREAGEPTASGNNSHWWTYTSAANGRLTVSTQGSSTNFTKTVVIYLGSTLANLKVLTWRIASEEGSFTIPVTEGTTYVISSGSDNPSYHGTTVLTCALQTGVGVDVSGLNIPNQATLANDSFAQAVSLTGDNVSAIGYNYPATRETGEPSTAQVGYNTLWWKYRASRNGRLAFSTRGSGGFAKTVTVFQGGTSFASLRVVAYSDYATETNLSFPVTADTDYIICTGSFSDWNHGSWVVNFDLQHGVGVDISGLNIPNAATMANDSFSNAVNLVGRQVSGIAYNSSSSRENGEPSISANRTHWWQHTTDAAGLLSLSSQGSSVGFGVTMVVYQGSSFSNLRPVAWSGSNSAVTFAMPVTANTSYYISTGSTSDWNAGSIVLTLGLQTGPGVPVSTLNFPNATTMSNDSFAQRVTLSGTEVSAIAYTLGATREALEPIAAGERTLWFSWMAPVTGSSIIDLTGSEGSNLQATVWQGTTVGTLTQVERSAWIGLTSSFNTTAGQTYHIALGRSVDWASGSSMVLTLFAPPSKPVFASPLTSRWLEVGQVLQITPDVSASGTTFRWQKNGVFLTAATSRIFSVGSSALTDAGAYRVEAKNSLGITLSGIANVGIMQMTGGNVTTNEGGILKLTANATGPAGALSYRWTRAGTDLADGRSGAQTITGSGTGTLTISGITPGSEGAYACRVTLANAAEPNSPLVKTSPITQVTVRLRPVVANTPTPAAAISQPFTWQLAAENSPTSFAAKGLPRGLVLNKTTGLITGAPQVSGTMSVSVTATNIAGTSNARKFSLSIGGLRSGLAGTYAGLVGRQQALNSQLGGKISVTVNKMGSISGTLRLGTSRYSVLGRVVTPLSSTPIATLSVTRYKLAPVTLNLIFPSDGGLGGEVRLGLDSAPVEGWLNSWRIDNTTAAHAGTYNALMDIPTELAGDTDIPQGYGWLKVSVAASTGKVLISGRTPDGATITDSCTLWPDGRVPLHALIYKSKGSIRGLPRVTIGGIVPSYTENRILGELDWLKTGRASNTDRTYAGGFGPILLDVEGSKWVRPATGTMLFNLPNQAGNQQIELAEAGISTVAQATGINQLFQLLPTGSCKFETTNGGNPTSMNLKVTTSSGLFSGSFKLTDPKPEGTGVITRNVKIAGMMIPHLSRGYGQFLLPELSPSPPVKAGSVLLQEP